MRAEGRPIRRLSPWFSPLGLSSALHPLRNARRENSIFAVAVSLVTIWTGYVRSVGLDPHSLWYDDLWVAAVVKVDSLFEAVSLQVPAPPAFVGALWLSKRLVPDPELSLQLVPYCASLAVIPVLAIVVATISRSRALGVVAGSLMALRPVRADLCTQPPSRNPDTPRRLPILPATDRESGTGSGAARVGHQAGGSSTGSRTQPAHLDSSRRGADQMRRLERRVVLATRPPIPMCRCRHQ